MLFFVCDAAFHKADATHFFDGLKMKVLIVDDSKVARMSLGRLIHSLADGYVIDEAKDVPSGLDVVASGLPDIAIIDLNMPGPDGLVLIESLIEKGMAADRLAVLTANIQSSVRARVEALGVTFIAKPASSEALRAFMNQTSEVG